MNVSNFEVGIALSATTVATTAYQLRLTNLAKIPILFSVESWFTEVPGTSAPEVLTLADLRLSATLQSGPTTWRMSGSVPVGVVQISIEPNQSSVFTILPSYAGSATPYGGFEGYTVLRVPAIRDPRRFAITSQSSGPVKVLLSATQTFARPLFKAYGRNLEGVTQFQLPGNDLYNRDSVALASGKAENDLEPEGLSLHDVVGAVEKLGDLRRTSRLLDGALSLAEEDRIPALVDLLAHLSADAAGLQAINSALQTLSSDIRLRPS